MSAAEEEIRGAARVSVDNTTDEKRTPSRNEARAQGVLMEAICSSRKLGLQVGDAVVVFCHDSPHE